MHTQHARWIAVLATGTLACASALAAVNLPKEGSYDFVSCWTGTSNEIAGTKEYSASAYEMLGTIVSTAPGGFGDQSSFRCVGMSTMVKGRPGGGNLCESTDTDGDKRVSVPCGHRDPSRAATARPGPTSSGDALVPPFRSGRCPAWIPSSAT